MVCVKGRSLILRSLTAKSCARPESKTKHQSQTHRQPQTERKNKPKPHNPAARILSAQVCRLNKNSDFPSNNFISSKTTLTKKAQTPLTFLFDGTLRMALENKLLSPYIPRQQALEHHPSACLRLRHG